MIAATWVDLYHAAFVSKTSLEQENERIRMSAIRKDLETCYSSLQDREGELQQRIAMLGRQAVMYKHGRNLAAAKKKMMERARAMAQADKIQNSMLMIDMHRSTIEGATLDLSVLETLKASGDVLRQMGATGAGLRAVEGLVAGLEESMQNAAEITNVLSSGSVSGVVNTMAAFGVAVDEDELMRELDCLSAADEVGGAAKNEQEEEEEFASDRAMHLFLADDSPMALEGGGFKEAGPPLTRKTDSARQQDVVMFPSPPSQLEMSHAV
jgi:hypothetical protein